MELKDPYPAYDADSNIEAMLVQRFLEERGVDAYAFDYGAVMGHLGYGIQAERAQVWVSRDDEQRVAELLVEYEQHKAQRAAQRQALESQSIDAVCEACGKTSTYEGSLNGTTQHCLHCGGYVDVGEFDWPYEEDFGTPETDVG